jgi:hypothetical protein
MAGNDYDLAARLVEPHEREAVQYASNSTTSSGSTAISALKRALNGSGGTSEQRENARQRLHQLEMDVFFQNERRASSDRLRERLARARSNAYEL